MDTPCTMVAHLRLTADLNNARGLNGWPIATYTYVVLRTSTLRAGATCDNVHDTVAFWQWFLTAGVPRAALTPSGAVLGPLNL